MHFLAHYFLSSQPQNAEFSTGVVLPDLLRKFSRHYNSVIKNRQPLSNPKAEQLRLGVMHHYAQDAAFHSQPLFESWQQLIGEALEAEDFSSEVYRVFFLNHIAAEFMLDRWLLLNHREYCDAFYHQLSLLSSDALSAFFTEVGLQSMEADFGLRFERFMQHRFLYYFSDVERVSEGLCRVYNMAASQEIAASDREKLQAALRQLDTRFSNEYLELLHETKAILHLTSR